MKRNTKLLLFAALFTLGLGMLDYPAGIALALIIIGIVGAAIAIFSSRN